MNMHNSRITAHNLVLVAPTAAPLAPGLTLNHVLPMPYPARYHSYAALPKDRRLP